jgi:translocator protein
VRHPTVRRAVVRRVVVRRVVVRRVVVRRVVVRRVVVRRLVARRVPGAGSPVHVGTVPVMTDTRTRPAEPRSLLVLGGLLVLCVGGGGLIGVLFTGEAAAYQQYDLPAWAPPPWLFGPVWTVLYALMAVSAWLAWRAQHPYPARALAAFGVQLALNFAWTPAFFGAESPGLGLVTIAAVLLAVGWWVFEAWRVRRLAGALQVPYLVWVGFATALNLAIAVQN